MELKIKVNTIGILKDKNLIAYRFQRVEKVLWDFFEFKLRQ